MGIILNASVTKTSSFEHVEASDARLRYRLHYVAHPFNSTIPVFLDGKGLHRWRCEARFVGVL